jgi:hypothetical protein
MVTQPRVAFRVEPAEKDLEQALQDMSYGAAMQEADVTTIEAALQNILDLLMPALKSASPNSSTFLSCFKSNTNWSAVIGKSHRSHPHVCSTYEYFS